MDHTIPAIFPPLGSAVFHQPHRPFLFGRSSSPESPTPHRLVMWEVLGHVNHTSGQLCAPPSPRHWSIPPWTPASLPLLSPWICRDDVVVLTVTRSAYRGLVQFLPTTYKPAPPSLLSFFCLPLIPLLQTLLILISSLSTINSYTRTTGMTYSNDLWLFHNVLRLQ